MSESASILEKERSRDFRPVDKISVNNQGGGLSFWVPADDIELSSLTASENGLFLAFEDECDAYDEIEVDVPEDVADTEDKSGKITGKDPESGNDYEVGLDDNGNLTTEVIPSAIHIVVPPRKRKYLEGETLDFSGIHVYLMKKGTERYTCEQYPTGEIPYGELLFPVTVADSGGDGGGGTESNPHYKGKGSVSGQEIISADITASEGIKIGENEGVYATIWTQGATIRCTLIKNSDEIESTGYYIVASPLSPVPGVWFGSHDSGTEIYVVNTYTRNNKTVYYGIMKFPRIDGDFWENNLHVIPENVASGDKDKIAWEMIYDSDPIGDITIPVQWMRSDGEILEDTFTITIGEGEEQQEEEQGEEEQTDPFVGYADISYNGHFYNINRKKVPEIHYANGYVWQEGISTEYSVEQAASLGLIILLR